MSERKITDIDTPDIQVLENGLVVIAVHNPYFKSVTTLVEVGVGSRYETKETNGISHFLEHMFFKGSRKYPTPLSIAKPIESKGGSLDASTYKDHMQFWVKCIPSQTEFSSDIVSSMLREAVFDPEEIDREKKTVVLEVDQTDYSELIWDLYHTLQFGDHPLAWPIAGTKENIMSFTQDSLRTHMANSCCPSNMAVVYVGNLPGNIFDIAKSYFSDFKNGISLTFEPFQKALQDRPKMNIFCKEDLLTKLVLGVEAYGILSPQRYSTQLLSLILGEGVSSRLFYHIREKRGLVYDIQSVFMPYQDTGYFAVVTELNPEDLKRGLTIITDEMDKIASEKISDMELQNAKDCLIGRIGMAAESSVFVANTLGSEIILTGKIENAPDFNDMVNQVTPDDILNTAAYLFNPERFNLQIIGSVKKSVKLKLK